MSDGCFHRRAIFLSAITALLMVASAEQVRKLLLLPQKEKAARRRLFNSNLMISDQAAINAGFDLRR
jgi:hypothetical protein